MPPPRFGVAVLERSTIQLSSCWWAICEVKPGCKVKCRYSDPNLGSAHAQRTGHRRRIAATGRDTSPRLGGGRSGVVHRANRPTAGGTTTPTAATGDSRGTVANLVPKVGKRVEHEHDDQDGAAGLRQALDVELWECLRSYEELLPGRSLDVAVEGIGPEHAGQ